jgi:LPS-assembly protein
MRSQLQFVITAGMVCHLFLGATPVTSQALPPPATPPDAAQTEAAPSGCHLVLTSPPAVGGAPAGPRKGQKPAGAKPKAAVSEEQPVEVTARECEKAGDVYTLRGAVEVKFATYVFHGDTVTYDAASGEAAATGGAQLDGGPRDMHITASHAVYNIRSQTGKFYDVAGTTGARFRGVNVTLTSSSPIAFTAQMLEQTGPQEYMLHAGSVTSCELPHPKWKFHAAKIILRVGDSAKVYNSTFRIKGVPVLYLPYAAPPVERLGRQSGLLIPVLGSSTAKGTIVGDSFYWAINRSMDATLGGEYLSRRGWSLTESFRATPSQSSFINFNYFQVFDRGTTQTTTSSSGFTSTNKVNQGGEDIKLNAVAMFPYSIRGVASLEYLSSFAFRQAFAETFSQAVNSEVRSSTFLSKSVNGFFFNGYAARYQNFQSTTPGDVITILHVPGLDLSSVDHKIFASPLYWSYDLAAEGLRRSEPGFVTPGLVGRFDISPTISLPIFFRGWTIRPAIDLRNTVYTEENVPSPTGPVPTYNILNRRVLDTSLELRPPALAKVFDFTLAGRKIKHTIEPRVIYRYTNGLENFFSIIRFDYRDILSNTNEVEYGLTQRLYFKRVKPDCDEQKVTTCVPAGANEFITWEVKQKYFIDPDFGGAVVPGTRNVLTTTVDFTGIAFLTDPRRFAPIVSRLRYRTNGGDPAWDLDTGWELDYDTKKGRINSSTLYTTYHLQNYFLGASQSFFQNLGEIVFAPGTRTPLPPCFPGHLNAGPCLPQDFNQVRGLLGYGSPTKRGLSLAGSLGYDFGFNLRQFAVAQAAYNWDCCGFSFEYRRFFLPAVGRDENQYRFAFTLANIATFGNMKRQERLF